MRVWEFEDFSKTLGATKAVLWPFATLGLACAMEDDLNLFERRYFFHEMQFE